MATAPGFSALWSYQTLDQNDLDNPVLSRLQSLKAVWAGSRVEIPDDWIRENPVERCLSYAFRATISLPVVEALHRVRDKITPLPLEVQQMASMDFISTAPDFFSAISPEGDTDIINDIPLEESVFMDNLLNFRRLRSFLKYERSMAFEDFPDTDSIQHICDQISDSFKDIPGFFLRRNISNTSTALDDTPNPVDFALLIRQYGSTSEWQWEELRRGYHDTLLWFQNRAIAQSMRISPSHPAVILGIINEGVKSSPSMPFGPDTTDPAFRRLALQAEPSLWAIINAWELRQKQHGGTSDLPSWLLVFGLIVTNGEVTIVAHYPASSSSERGHTETHSGIRFCSCVMDTIPFHPEVHCVPAVDEVEKWYEPTPSDAWILDRLRLFLALLALIKNSKLISAVWDDIRWSREALELEDLLEKRDAQWDKPTPTPSELAEDKHAKGVVAYCDFSLASMLDDMEDIHLDEGSDDEEALEAERVTSRARVLEWRSRHPSSDSNVSA